MRLRPGLVLLLVVGFLGVLAVLSAAFVTLARLERRASQQRLYGTQALLLARSGLEDALARISSGQTATYGGEDWDADGALSAFEQQQEIFKPGMTNLDDCPVQHALSPSFFSDDGTGKPQYRPVGKLQRGFSGQLQAGSYALKVEDESAKINVNGGFLDEGDRDGDKIWDYCDLDVRGNPVDPNKDTGRGWNAQLARVLNLLGSRPEVLGPGCTNLGILVLRNRPPGGYASVTQLQQKIGVTRDLSPWLTTSSWIDTNVVHPNAYKSQSGKAAMNEIKTGRVPLLPEEGGRPPVNLEAASGPVLVALLQGLQGCSCVDPQYPSVYDSGFPFPLGLSEDMAALIAQDILDFRSGKDPKGFYAQAGLAPGPFATRSRFAAFVDSLVSTPAMAGDIQGYWGQPVSHGGGDLAVADMIKANFDPNSMLNKSPPDELMYRRIDKSDLTVWSTEGNLGPTGAFRVSAAGRVTAPSGALLAEARLGGMVRAFSLLRQTSQKEFVDGRQPDAYLSAASPTSLAPTAWGRGAMTYPSPMSALPGGNPSGIDASADFDGWVGLATLEDASQSLLGGGTAKAHFLHHFNGRTASGTNDWTADFSAGGQPGLLAGQAGVDDALPDVRASPWPAVSGIEPNTLCPDGVHVQAGRSPAYPALPNFPPVTAVSGVASNRFALGYWVKSKSSSWHVMEQFSVSRPEGAYSQTLLIGLHWDPGEWGIVVENSAASKDTNRERQYQVRNNTLINIHPGLRWVLVTALAEASAGQVGPDLFLNVAGIDYPVNPAGINQGAPPLVDDMTGPSYHFWDPALAQDLLAPADAVRMVLGDQAIAYEGSGFNHTADAVIDEFEICDFGPPGESPAPLTKVQLWASERWRGGRYYKLDDATFTSTKLIPAQGAPSHLLRVWWTEYRPPEIRQENRCLWGEEPFPFPRSLDPVLGDARVELDLLNAAGAELGPLSQGGGIGTILQEFRYQVTFVNGLDPAQQLNAPVLETPVFDDITFAWQPVTGPRILRWEP